MTQDSRAMPSDETAVTVPECDHSPDLACVTLERNARGDDFEVRVPCSLCGYMGSMPVSLVSREANIFWENEAPD